MSTGRNCSVRRLVRESDEEFLRELRQQLGLHRAASAADIARAISVAWHAALPRITSVKDEEERKAVISEYGRLADAYWRVIRLARH